MKCTVESRLLIFNEVSPEELDWLQHIFTWEYEDRPKETLLFKHPQTGVYYTYWGFHTVLQNSPYSVDIDFVDKPRDGNIVKDIDPFILDGVKLFDFQLFAIRKCIANMIGFSNLPTGSGKTEVMLALLRLLMNMDEIRKGVIVVPSTGLADQFFERAMKRGFTKDEIGIIDGTRKQWDKRLTIFVVNSLNNALKNEDNKAMKKIIDECDILLYDESHHLRADMFMGAALKMYTVKYLQSFSGSAYLDPENVMEDSGDALILGLTGGIINQVSYSYLQSIGLIAEPVVHFKRVGGPPASYYGKWNNIYNTYIVKNEPRNNMIVDYARKMANLGFPVLILVQRLPHAEKLMKMMTDLKAVAVFGGGKGLQINEHGQVEDCSVNYDDFRNQFNQGRWNVAFMSQVGDEGFDVPNIGCVIMAGAGKSRIKALQRIGRGLRAKSIGPNRVYILDFFDNGHVYLKAHSKKRMNLYEEIEATVEPNEYRWFNMACRHSEEVAHYKSIIGETFIESCRAGKTPPDKMDSFIRRKMKGNPDVPIWDYIGITERQYELYQRNPVVLEKILNGEM